MRYAKALLRRLALAYLLICLFMWAWQRHIMYLPGRDILGLQAYGLTGFEDLWLIAADGTHIDAWYHKASPGYPTIVDFHGNGGHMGGRARFFRLLADEGFGILALDYRGYGKSEGSPTEAGFYQDARATINYAEKNLSLQPGQMVVYGESIGTGVAVQVATEYPFAGIVLQSPFTSLVALGQDLYPWLPVSFLQVDRFDSIDKIGSIHMPLLMFHGEKDEIVPVRYGRMVFAHANEPKEAIYFPDKGHVNFDLSVLAKDVLAFSRKYKLIKN